MRNKKGFTLVELIVVIAILAILGTIAFLSMQGYSSNARDSTRTSDLSSIQTSLELFITKVGAYPLPTSYTGVTYSGGVVWNQGTFGNEPFKQLGDINKLPIDPLTNNEYTYSVTASKSEYEIAGVYESVTAKNNILLNSSYADGKINGISKIEGTYNGFQLYVQTGGLNFTIFTPTIINGDISITDMQQIINQGKLVINGKNKLPDSYKNSNFKDNTITLNLPNILISTGSLTELKAKTQSGIDLRKIYLTNLKSILTGSTLVSNYTNLTNLDVNNTTSDLIALSLINGKGSGGGSSSVASTTPTIPTTSGVCGSANNTTGATLPTTNLCSVGTATTVSGSGPWTWSCNSPDGGSNASCIQNSNLVNGVCSGLPSNANYYNSSTSYSLINATAGTSLTANYNATPTTNTCQYNCTGGYTGTNCDVAPSSGWTSLDPNCDISDITIGSQIWAGCNSTLGTGIEYSVDQNCYNYVGGTTTGCNRASNEKENVYNPTYGVNNIWGKLYTWDNSSSACPTGRHVPTDLQWEILETTLNGSNCRNSTNGWLCDGLGWAGHTSKNSTNNIIEALKLPLAGFRRTDGSTFGFRGFYAFLWSSTAFDATNVYNRYLNYNSSSVNRNNNNKSIGFSVRCLKD